MPRENAACAFKAKMRLRHSRCDAQERLSARGNPTERKRRNSSRVCLARASHSRSRRRRRRAREGGQDREESARSQSLPRRRVPDPTERWCLGHSPSQRRVVEWLHRTPRGGDVDEIFHTRVSRVSFLTIPERSIRGGGGAQIGEPPNGPN